MTVVRRMARTAVGVALGVLTAVAGLGPLAAALIAPTPARPAVARAVAVERWRVATLLDGPARGGPAHPDRARPYLAARLLLGLLGGAV